MPPRNTSLIVAVRALFRWEDVGIWILAGLLLLNVVHLALLDTKLDFKPVYGAARAVLEGRPPYGLTTHGGDYVHTPGSTLLSLPFGLVPENVGAASVVATSALAFLGGALAPAAATNATPRATAVVVLAFSLSGPLLRELGLAN